MLKIRLSRTGKRNQPAYRVVVQEHTAPTKGKFIEKLGNYRPAVDPKDFSVDLERVKYWLSVGAKPSDTMAVLLKAEGVKGMDEFIAPRNLKRKKKKEEEEKAEAPKAEAPAEEKPAEAPKAEAPAEEKPAEAPKAEAPAEEPKKEASTEEKPAEAPAEAPAAEEKPAEEAPVEEPKEEESTK